MNDSTVSSVSTLPPPAESRFDRLVAKYREDHRHPVNHVLHVGVGWPIMAAAVILVPFRPLWSLGLFFLSYAIMWTGHFVFERNLPTIFKHPTHAVRHRLGRDPRALRTRGAAGHAGRRAK